MTLAELMAAARVDLDDSGSQPLFVDAWLKRRINQAVTEACRRARLIEDSETANDGASPTPNPICLYTVASGARLITPDPRIILVKRVKLGSQDLPLPRKHAKDLDRLLPGWETSTGDDVACYVTDYTKGKIYFNTAFSASDTVRLTVVREPLSRSPQTPTRPRSRRASTRRCCIGCATARTRAPTPKMCMT
jgi:hypothetical protein